MFRIITGSVIFLIGLGFLIGSVIEQDISGLFGIAIIAVGVAILLNKHEDEIEEIKSDKI